MDEYEVWDEEDFYVYLPQRQKRTLKRNRMAYETEENIRDTMYDNSGIFETIQEYES